MAVPFSSGQPESHHSHQSPSGVRPHCPLGTLESPPLLSRCLEVLRAGWALGSAGVPSAACWRHPERSPVCPALPGLRQVCTVPW